MRQYLAPPSLLDNLGRRTRRWADRFCLECGKQFRPMDGRHSYCSRQCGWAGVGKRNSRPRIVDRLAHALEKIERVTESGCWIWMGGSTAGYGTTNESGRSVKVHRFMYEQLVGPINPGMYLCHRCDVRICCNPAHLFQGTAYDNMNDARNKRRFSRMTRTKCSNGHDYSPENTMFINGRSGHRIRRCKTCAAIWEQRHLEKKRAAK